MYFFLMTVVFMSYLKTQPLPASNEMLIQKKKKLFFNKKFGNKYTTFLLYGKKKPYIFIPAAIFYLNQE